LNSAASAVLSFFILGLGHIIINGQTQRGALWLVGGIISGVVLFFVLGFIAAITLGLGLLLYPVMLVIPALSAYDAYDQAEKINAGEVTV